jgi:23S rRNA (uracil1939-C5)-methyltransferase
MSRTHVPVQLGNTYELVITGLSHEGHGVGRHAGFAVFVPGALAGETVRVRIRDVQKRFATAELVEILEPSTERVAPVCPVYEACGGCQLQHLSYSGQLAFKEQHVRDVLQRIGHLDLNRVRVHPILGMKDPWRYRNKAQVPVGPTRRSVVEVSKLHEEAGLASGLIAGFYERGTHEIVDVPGCHIQDPANEAIILEVRDILRELRIPAYDRWEDRGCIRHIIAKVSANTGQTMIVLVTRSRELPNKDRLIRMIRERISHVASIMQNIQPEPGSKVMGSETLCLWGATEIYDQIGSIRFAISAESFYQVNPVQTEVLYAKALEYADLKGNETVIDAYCGVGTISLFLAKSARHVYGIEIVKDAVRDAQKNAELNGITNATFLVGKAEVEIPRLYREGIKADVIVVDPPRKGCDEALLATIVKMRPKRVVYVSCNPSTLARDLRYLEDHGYQTAEVQPVDLFPHTAHVECCALIKWASVENK